MVQLLIYTETKQKQSSHIGKKIYFTKRKLLQNVISRQGTEIDNTELQ